MKIVCRWIVKGKHLAKVVMNYKTSVQYSGSPPLIFCAYTLFRHCWVCFATERDDYSAEWVSPCRCKGCTKWIHQSCLQRWLDEKQKGNSEGAVSCPQCGTEYQITFPKMGNNFHLLIQ